MLTIDAEHNHSSHLFYRISCHYRIRNRGGGSNPFRKKALGKHTSAFEQSENGSNNLKKKALYKMMPSTSMLNTVDYVVKE